MNKLIVGMKFLVGMAAAAITFSAAAENSYRMNSIMLLQPDFVLKQRAPSTDSLSAYIKAVQSSAGESLSDATPVPSSGYLVLAVRPGGRSMVWLDFKPALPEPIAAKLRSSILAVPAFEAKKGVVVFALNSSLWDAPSASGFPNPPEWSNAMGEQDGPIEIGALVDRVWPDQGSP